MTPVDRLLSTVEWTACPVPFDAGDLPYPVMSGILSIAGHQLRCHQLNTGQRIFDADDVMKLFSPPEGTGSEE